MLAVMSFMASVLLTKAVCIGVEETGGRKKGRLLINRSVSG